MKLFIASRLWWFGVRMHDWGDALMGLARRIEPMKPSAADMEWAERTIAERMITDDVWLTPEEVLARDWDTPEEDEAWKHL